MEDLLFLLKNTLMHKGMRYYNFHSFIMLKGCSSDVKKGFRRR